MPTYTSSGAGTAAYNDDWTEAGTYNTKAYYTGDAHSKELWWHDGLETWVMSDVAGGAVGSDDYYTGGEATPLSTDGAWAQGTNGASPAPTVVAYSGGGGGGGTLTSTGWLSPTVVTDQSDGDVWVNKDNAKAQDDAYATYLVEGGEFGHTDDGGVLDLTGFALDAIAADDTIVGVAVRVDAWGDESVAGAEVFPKYVKLMTTSGVVGDDLGQTDTACGTSDTDTYEEFGGSAEDWGAGLDGGDMDADFGVRLGFRCTVPAAVPPSAGESCTIKVDHVLLKVWYLDADGAGGAATKHAFMGVL